MNHLKSEMLADDPPFRSMYNHVDQPPKCNGCLKVFNKNTEMMP